jgi:hypothetical protein
MELISSNTADITKYYGDSYVRIAEVGDKILLLKKVTPDAVYLIDADELEYALYLHDEVPYTLNMVLPHKAMFQHGKYCCLLSRLPARQYSRGITSENCRIERLTNEGWLKVGINFESLQAFINKPQYRWLDHAIETPVGMSEAITNRFAYRASDRSLRIDQVVIGSVTDVTKTIGVKALFVPEVTKLLSPTTLYTVKGI